MTLEATQSNGKLALPTVWQPLVDQAANALRAFALDEDAKTMIAANPALEQIAYQVSKRYVGGQTTIEALATMERIGQVRNLTVDYMGESCRDRDFANTETEVILGLIQDIQTRAIPSSISLDLSHIGSIIDIDFAYENAARIARACQDIGTEMIISAEQSDRTDLTQKLHARLCQQFDNVGITVQARLHRTEQDLEKLLERPGKIRLVKGAYLESERTSHARNSPELAQAYRKYAKQLLESTHICSIATHDRGILDELHQFILEHKLQTNPYEFEMLLGLWDDQLDLMKAQGHATREYVVYGKEWFLYVLNRIAEEPVRVYQALVDAVEHGSS